MPRFSQLFFHDFSDEEVLRQSGHAKNSSVSRRAAEAYLRSGVRLQSKCGLSDVWYDYVEANRTLFENPDHPLPPWTPGPPSPHPHDHTGRIPSIFQWYEQHSRPRPRKITPTSTLAVTQGDDVEGGTPAGSTEGISRRFDEFGFDVWPTTLTFHQELFETIDEAGRAADVQPQGLTSTIHGANAKTSGMRTDRLMEIGGGGPEWMGEEDGMEGVEASQSSEVRTHTETAESSDGEAGESDGLEAVDMQGVECTGESKCNCGMFTCLMLTSPYSLHHGSAATFQS